VTLAVGREPGIALFLQEAADLGQAAGEAVGLQFELPAQTALGLDRPEGELQQRARVSGAALPT